MKQQTIAGLLVTLLFVSAVATVLLALNYFFSVRNLDQVRTQFVQINNTRTAMQGLANDALEYSKRNPDLVPVLQEFEAKPRQAAPTNSPASTPAKSTR